MDAVEVAVRLPLAVRVDVRVSLSVAELVEGRAPPSKAAGGMRAEHRQRPKKAGEGGPCTLTTVDPF